MNPNKKIFPFFLVWFFACGIGLYFRLYPLINYTSNEAFEKATLFVLANLRKSAEETIQQGYPGIPEIEKNHLIKKRFDATLHEERKNARKTIQKIARRIDQEHPPKQKFPYLLASDSYYYFGLTQTIQKTGALGKIIRQSKYLNPLMLAPLGHFEPLNWHPFAGYYLYKIISFLHPHIPLMDAVSFTPLVVTVLAVIPFLFICFLLRCSPLASFTGAVFLLTAPIFLTRSTLGWYDNDPYNILFPFAILSVLFYGMPWRRKDTKTVFLWGCLCAALICLYALFWHGWVFLESVIIACGILILLCNHFVLRKKKATRNLLGYFAVITLGTFAGIGIIFGMGEFFTLFKEGLSAVKNFLTPQLAYWPDLYIGVGELHKASLFLIINLTGGVVFFAFATWGLVIHALNPVREFFLKKKTRRRPKDNSGTLFCVLIIAVFLFFAVVLSLGAQRFALLCLVPLSLLFTLGIQHVFDVTVKVIQRQVKRPGYRRLIIRLILPAATLALCVWPVLRTYHKMPSLLNPIFNATWERTLTKIRENTPETSIINTWWPPGHFIKSIAQRKVTFDGATINTPQAYWLANVLLNTDEHRALGILRMMNNSANQAAEYLVEAGWELSRAVDVLKEITPLSRPQAKKALGRLMNERHINALLKLTHASPPPSYLLIYNELIEKHIELSFVGNWNFKRIEEINTHPELRRDVPSPGSRDYIRFLWNLAGGQPKYHAPLNAVAQSKELIVFENNIKINLKNMRCIIDSQKFGKGIPYSLLYLKDDHVVEKKFSNATLPYSVLFAKQAVGYICVLLDTHLARSLMMRLYFFEGKGLKHIRPFLKETDLTRRTQISVYEIDWEGF